MVLREFSRRLAGDREGAAAILVAGGLAMGVAFGAVAIDLGYVYLQSRKLQGVADLAAMAAAGDLAHANAAAAATAGANGWDGPLQVEVTTGVYKAQADIAPSARFVAGASAPDAARVVVSGESALFFGQAILGRPTLTLTRSATAARAELASFSIGTRLASLNGGVANELLGALTGSSVSLSVMDYNALVGAEVDLLAYSQALRSRAAVEGLSFEEALSADISTGEALGVLADLLDTNGDNQAATSARKLATAAGTQTPADLDRLIDLGPYGKQDRLSASAGTVEVSAMELANAMLLLAQEGRVLKLDFSGDVPGLADLDVWLAIGQRPNHSPWLSVDHDGDVVVRTAQMRLYADAKILSLLGLLGLKAIRAPLLIEAASGEAKISALDCPMSVAAQGATLAVRPGLGKLILGDVDTSKLNDFGVPLTPGPATVLDLAAAKVSGHGQVDIGGASWKQVRFSRHDIQTGVVKTVATDDIAEATVASLMGDVSLTVTVAGLGLVVGGGVIKGLVSGALTAAAAPLDGVLNSLTALLGVRLGEADVRVHGLRCRNAALVA